MRTNMHDLEERTARFAMNVRAFVSLLPKCVRNFEDGRQLIRSSESVGANYIEAGEALSKKDFLLRMRIARKEAKESWYWLKLIFTENSAQENMRLKLLQESMELRKILSAIISNSNSR